MKKRELTFLKKLNLNFPIAIFSFLMATAFTSCESLNGGCGDVKPDILYCDTNVTVVGAGCANGAFQSRWLKLDNGDLLQPFENLTYLSEIEVGQRFKIGYEIMKRDKRYEGQLMCAALPPKGTPIRLLCITPEKAGPGKGCNTIVTARTVECSFGAWGTTWFQLEDGSYLQPWNNATNLTQLTPGEKYKIGYSEMVKDKRFNNGVICSAMPNDPKAWTPTIVSVECIEQVNGN